MIGTWLRKPDSKTAVVFAHGILSSGETCWKSANGAIWPNLLAEETEFQGLGIYVYTYQTHLFSGSYSLSDVVDDLKERMRLDGLFGMTRLVFVCHSMGGLVVRKLLVERAADFERVSLA